MVLRQEGRVVNPVLTPFQEELLRAIAGTEIGEAFFLTGGTALSAFHLHHRLSEDLDFFTSDDAAMTLVRPSLERAAAILGARVEYRRAYATFVDCRIHRPDDEHVLVDFAVDQPYRLNPPVRDTEYGILVDDSLDIACNKLSALFDRHEPKDFVDVYFVDRELYRFPDVLRNARKKHVGMDGFWLAQSLKKADSLILLPRMLKKIDLAEMKRFFLEWAEQLIDEMEDR